MIHIVTPVHVATAPRRLPFYLAVEEWVAHRMPADHYFFTWIVAPTVIFGRNQDVTKEVDLEYCREHSIEVYRRRSGGGCVYADYGNLMMSCISPLTDVTTTFAAFTAGVAQMLRGLGLNAEATGRNDVLVDGHKVSGNAFYHLPTRSIMHGTLLYDTDVDNMCGAITPARSKLESHRVTSVASRTTTLRPLLPDLGIHDLQNHIIKWFTDSEYVLTPYDIAEIEEVEQHYYDLKWIFGRGGVLSDVAHTARTSRRIPGVGSFNVSVVMDGESIEDVQIMGDFFMLCDLDTAIFQKIKGHRLHADDLSVALADTDVSEVITGLSTSEFIQLLCSAHLPARSTSMHQS